MNPVLALMENDSHDAFANDVANAYFANPDHVRRLLNADCIEECVSYVLDNQRVEFDLSDLDLFEDKPFFAKPSRQRGKRKHDKKAVRRKGSVKRFRDRSRHWQAEEHECSVYSRNLCGDWNRRGRRLAKTGEVAFKSNRRMHTDNCAPFIPDPSVDEMDDVTMTFGDVSMTMNCSDWRNYEEQWDAFCNAYAFHELRDNNNYSLWDEYWDNWDKQSEPNPDEFIENEDNFESDEDETIPDTQISAIEMADIVNQIAYATPDECVKIREFFRSL